MGAFGTYGEVFVWVQGRAGGCISSVEDAEVALRMALLSIRDSLGEAEDQIIIPAFTSPGVASLPFPPSIAVLTAVERDGLVLSMGERSMVSKPGDAEASGPPQRYSLDGNKRIWFHPIPDEVYRVGIRGFGYQNCTLKENDTWLPIALPSGLDGCYAKSVLALCLADSAPSRAAMWQNMANIDMANWKERQLTVSGDRFVMNGTDDSDFPYINQYGLGHKIVFDVIPD